MLRVYARGVKAPYADARGGYFKPADEGALIDLVNKLGGRVVEIVVRGKTSTPLEGHATKVRVQMMWCGSAWGLRGADTFYCRGCNLDEVLTLRDELQDG